ncbi:PP2C-domain-containing protein [Daedalea quercina L-15889]|uniref:protein-serine/threonine phosphatase n=1 Tax=Daedalea quercina L-15889 TaxID=1314783 RepID=A0A165TQE2_9APHY|nr:PP2C-domain-containing protein [Daedalea quercina L-15889]
MGQTLSIPATDKTTENGGNKDFYYGVAEMQGWRFTMEDAHTITLNLDGSQDDSNTFFAVYDGHGGGAAAKYAGENVHKNLVSDEAYQRKEYRAALKNAFLRTDDDMRTVLLAPGMQRDGSGCTAVAALVTKEGKVLVANAGDSRSVISVKGEAIPLSYDHKPQNEVEKNRIAAAGGYISCGRVNGNLALARALGDFDYKRNEALSPEAQIITCDPEIVEHEMTDEDEFLIIACDGIWDCLTSQQCVDVIRLMISQGKDLSQVCEDICELCLAPDTNSGAGIGCDNMTILIVAILHGRTTEEWYKWITERTQQKYGHPTPDELPQLYSPSRLASFKARREAWEARKAQREAQNASGSSPDKDQHFGDGDDENLSGPGMFGGFARVLGSTGGISFHPSTGITIGAPLMFDNDDDDDSDEADMEDAMGIYHSGEGTHENDFSMYRRDATKSLKEQLDELEREDGLDNGGDVKMNHNSSLQGEAPPPPLEPKVNGDAAPLGQHSTPPGGDETSPAVKAEGLLDKSEDPLKV